MTEQSSSAASEAVGGLPMVSITGTPHQMGRTLGRRLKARIERIAAETYGMIADGSRRWDRQRQADRVEVEGMAAEAADILRGFEASLWREMEGMASAAGTNVDALLAIHAYQDLLSRCDTDRPAAESSTLLIPGERTSHGRALLAHAWYLPEALMDNVVVVRRIPDHGPNTLCLTLAGLHPVVGLAESKTAVASNDLRVLDGHGEGLVSSFQLSAMLAAPSHEEAIARAESGPRLGGRAFHVLAADGRRASLEGSGRTTALLPDPRPEAPRVHANHPVSGPVMANSRSRGAPGSRARLGFLASEVVNHQGRLGVNDLVRMLGPEARAPGHWPATDAPTACVVCVADPAKRTMAIAPGGDPDAIQMLTV